MKIDVFTVALYLRCSGLIPGYRFISSEVKQTATTNGFLVSKETVVPRRCESKTKIFVSSNELIKVELPP